MKILVTGAQGQLGQELCRVLRGMGEDVIGADRSDFDLTDSAAVKNFISRVRPHAILHCAAFTDVDRAEREPLLCRRVNLDGTAYLADAAESCGSRLLYISTDYVFSGDSQGFYGTRDRPRPLSVYGETKYRGEEAVLSLCSHAFVLRTSWVFGLYGKNFVSTILRLAQQRKELSVVCDQVGSPTYTRDLSRLIAQMIRTDRYGIYHATNEGVCSRAEFAEEILRQASFDVKVIPVPSSLYPTAAKRPLNSRLSKRRLDEEGFSRLPFWKDALSEYLTELNETRRAALSGKRQEP